MTNSDKRTGRKVKNERTPRNKKTKQLLLAELFEKAYRIKKSEGLAESTLWRYEYIARLFIDYLNTIGHSVYYADLDVQTCRDFSIWLQEERRKYDQHKYQPESNKTKGISPKYVNDIIKTMRTMFNLMIDDGVIDKNPFTQVKNVKQPQKIINILTPEELRQILTVLDKKSYAQFRDYCIIILCVDTMGRIGEILSLTTDDVNLKNKEVIFRSEITKTRRGRIIPIQDRTARLLKELIEENEDFDNKHIFLTNYGADLTPNHFRQRLKVYAKKAGITKNVHPHLIRHSAATIYLESGGNLRYLQSILGHVDQRMTSRYTHLSRVSLAENHGNFSAMNKVLNKLNKERKTKRKNK